MHDLDDLESTSAPAANGAQSSPSGMTSTDGLPMRPRRKRSRISTGARLLPTVHPQSVWGRLMRDTLDSLVIYLGGEDQVSEPQRMACRRIALLETELIHLEDAIGTLRCQGREPTSEMLDLYARLGNAQRRFCEALGWQRVPKDVTPSLSSYLQANKADDAV